MEEELLQFVWETRSFHAEGWRTLAGQTIEVVNPGILNRDQGPDFLYAHVRIGGLDHFGHVEIHVDSRDWYRHRHDMDANYSSVVLHVVLRPQLVPVLRVDGTEIPEGSLEGRILPGIEAGRRNLMKGKGKLACGELLRGIPRNIWEKWVNRLAKDRLEMKVNELEAWMDDPAKDWEQTLLVFMAGALAGPVNKEAFRALAERLPVRVLKKYAHQTLSREALLFGLSGALLGDAKDDYHRSLQREWAFLSRLHGLSPSPIAMRFHRMRPGAFPTYRLSQLGALAARFGSWVQLLNPKAMRDFVKSGIQATPYWRTHLGFGRRGCKGQRKMRPAFMRILFLNSLAPMGILYARAHGRGDLEEQIVNLMRELPAEQNRITNHFCRSGISPSSAWEGQAQIGLFKNYCREKRCMSCVVGRWILGERKVNCLSSTNI